MQTIFPSTKLHILCLNAKQVDAGTNNNNFVFREDSIFGTNASLTYGPQIQRHLCVDNYIVLTMNIIYSMYRAGEVSIRGLFGNY